MSGIFYGIGVGPGDPELLTIKAVNAIRQVDVLIAPKTEKKDGSVALTAAQPYLKENVKIIYQVFPMVKDFEKTSSDIWDANKQVILKLLEEGKNVAFLTIGDPMLYSTYIYIFQRLKKDGVDIRTIPGIPAFAAIGSMVGHPIVEGDNILSIIPATASLEKIKKAIAVSDNVVLMKVAKSLEAMTDLLEKNNMLEQAVLVSRAGLDNEQIIHDVKAHRKDKLNYLSTILARRN